MKRFLFIFSLLSMVSTAQKLTVMTYNIRYDTPTDGINSWSGANRKEKVCKIIEEQNPDIFGVQEALHNQIEDLEKFTEYQRVGVGRDDGMTKGEYIALFFKKDKFELLDSGHFWLSQTPEKPSKGWDGICCNRICTWIKLRYAAKDLYVFNVHFDHEGKQAQAQSAKLMLQKMQEIASNVPAILMGDLNMTPDNTSIQIIARKLYNARQKASAEIKDKGTFNNFKPQEPLQGYIDYIFVTKKIKVKNFIIIDQLIDDLYPSDHLPVVVTLQM